MYQLHSSGLAISGAKKAAKVSHRTAGEGLVSASVLSRGTGSSPGGVRAALVELNCETDFVARNALFGRRCDMPDGDVKLSEPYTTRQGVLAHPSAKVVVFDWPSGLCDYP